VSCKECRYIIEYGIGDVPVHAAVLIPSGCDHIPQGDMMIGQKPGKRPDVAHISVVEEIGHNSPELVMGIRIILLSLDRHLGGETAKYKN